MDTGIKPKNLSSDPIAQLVEAAREWGIPLDTLAQDRIVSYLNLVRQKNETTNLTADSLWEDLVLKHAADGVFAAAQLKKYLVDTDPSKSPRILDLGSGGGFIGICLKIAWPEADVSLMEAVERKFNFLNAATVNLGLPGLCPLKRRAGAAPIQSSYEKDFDVVIERALAPLPEAIRLAVPLLRPGGVFAAFQSESPNFDDHVISRALVDMGARVLDCVSYRRPAEVATRRLVIFSKIKD